jgi:hypothetical protein
VVVFKQLFYSAGCPGMGALKALHNYSTRYHDQFLIAELTLEVLFITNKT